MSQYRFEVHKPSGRKAGSQGAVAKAAYINREKYYNELEGKHTADYSRKHNEEHLWSAIFVDKTFNPPAWVNDPERLWNEAAAAERRRDALECQDAVGNLPHELTLEQNKRWITDFIREELTRGAGRVVNVAFHNPSEKSDDRNVHAHMMWSLRAIGPDGFEERLPMFNPADISHLRERWAHHGARALERAAREENRPELKTEAERWRVGHLTLDKQRKEAIKRGDHEWAKDLDREPQLHMGPKATAMERDGVKTRKREKNRAIEEENRRRAEEQLHEPEVSKKPLSLDEIEASIPKHLKRDARELWLAYNTARDAKHFDAELETQGMKLARVTKEDMEENKYRNPQFAEKYAPKYEVGEYVAVNSRGWAYKLNERTVGSKPEQVKEFLKPLDKTAMPSMKDRVTEMMDRPQSRGRDGTKGIGRDVGNVAKVGSKVLGLGVGIANALLPPLTPQEKAEGQAQQEELKRLGDEAEQERRRRGREQDGRDR